MARGGLALSGNFSLGLRLFLAFRLGFRIASGCGVSALRVHKVALWVVDLELVIRWRLQRSYGISMARVSCSRHAELSHRSPHRVAHILATPLAGYAVRSCMECAIKKIEQT